MSTQDPQSIVDANEDAIETFVSGYLLDNGIGVQLLEVIARELFGQQVKVNGTVPEDVATAPKDLLSAAIQDIVEVGLFSGSTYTLQSVIDGAASLEFLVRYARKVSPVVIPPQVIPTDEVVNAALALFHAARQSQAVTG